MIEGIISWFCFGGFLKTKDPLLLIASGLFAIGANIAESECAISRNDFLAKIYIALKEANESLYWLELMYETEYLTEQEYISLKNDCEELKRMLQSTTKTMVDTQ